MTIRIDGSNDRLGSRTRIPASTTHATTFGPNMKIKEFTLSIDETESDKVWIHLLIEVKRSAAQDRDHLQLELSLLDEHGFPACIEHDFQTESETEDPRGVHAYVMSTRVDRALLGDAVRKGVRAVVHSTYCAWDTIDGGPLAAPTEDAPVRHFRIASASPELVAHAEGCLHRLPSSRKGKVDVRLRMAFSNDGAVEIPESCFDLEFLDKKNEPVLGNRAGCTDITPRSRQYVESVFDSLTATQVKSGSVRVRIKSRRVVGTDSAEATARLTK